MATVYFLDGSSRTDFNTSTNFNTQPDGSGSSGFPTNGDTLIFADCKQQIATGGTALSAVTLAAVYVLPSASVTTAPGVSLTLDVSSGNGFMSYAGSGGIFAVTAGANTIETLHVKSSAGQFHLFGGTTAVLGNFGGQVYVGGSAVVTTAYMAGGYLEAAYNATGFTTLDVQAGRVVTKRSWTTCNMTGATEIITLDAAAGTTTNVHAGRFNPRSRGTYATVNFRGGVMTPVGAITPVTVTTLNLYGSNTTGQYYSLVGSNSFTVGTTNTFGTMSAIQVDQSAT